MLAAAKNNPATRDFAESLEITFKVQEWIDIKPKDDFVRMLLDENAKLLDVLKSRLLKKSFFSAQSDIDAKDTAERLAEQQMKHVFDNPLWNTWMLYMKKLDSREHITEQELSEPILAVLRKNFKDRYLSKQFEAAESDEGKSRAKFFMAALLEAQQKRERAIKRQGIEDIATAPIKRQRNDDGQ
ncbi:unnamed protein product [Peronospora farinosa]|uniref:Uncharacterized protein n=1 Tax=Peronospora farinosa TaxID=134698 RepID=A0ABN8C3X4_9STRA|nr:unnamed protein product [Peronospora farinosa]